MLGLFDRMVNCINGKLKEYRASFGFNNSLIDRPVLEKAVYITSSEIREKEIDFVIYVYSPLSLGGNECLKTACEVYNILFEDGFSFKDIAVGAVEYNSNSQGFVVKIKGTAEDNSLDFKNSEPEIEKIDCNISYEITNGTVDYSFQAKSCKISCDTGDYPIMTIFHGEPIDFINGVKSYKIVLGGIDSVDGDFIIMSRNFKLDTANFCKSFKKCRFEKYEVNSEGEYTFTIVGY